MLTLTKAELIAVLEHGVANIGGGQFAQVAGVVYSYDPDLPAGDRIQNAAVVGEVGEVVAPLVRGGEIVGDLAEKFRIVTLNFLADGGDSYPFPTGPSVDRLDLFDLDGDSAADEKAAGTATFAFGGTEQDAFAEYLAANFVTDATTFNEPDIGHNEDERIQNLNFRADAVFGPNAASVVISEIMYDPASAEDDWEWVEITNLSDDAVGLTGWVIDDGNTVFQTEANIAGGTIEAGGSAVLYNADDLTADAFAAAWGEGLNLVGVTN